MKSLVAHAVEAHARFVLAAVIIWPSGKTLRPEYDTGEVLVCDGQFIRAYPDYFSIAHVQVLDVQVRFTPFTSDIRKPALRNLAKQRPRIASQRMERRYPVSNNESGEQRPVREVHGRHRSCVRVEPLADSKSHGQDAWQGEEEEER